jgi:dTDP-4-amino-4,6-dideoxygalactose transaminase
MDKLALNGGTPVRTRPFPKRQPFGEDDLREVREALESQDLFFTSNNKIAALEREFAAKYGTKHAVGTTSGTAAVHMAVAALDAGPGDEIITAPVTDFGTVAGIIFQGLIPIFADWKPGAFNMDPADVEKKIGPRTRGIIAVHLFGNPCDLDALAAIAARRGIPLIEDCAQAYCTPYKGRWAGSIGDIGTFSMQQSKHLPTGEGGITITNNADYALRMALFRDKGWQNRAQMGPRTYTLLGLNYRMNELTGAVARAQLRKVEGVVKAMTRLGNRLTELIRDIDGIYPCPVTPGGEHSYWLYAFRVTGYDPQPFVKALAAEGIPAGWGYTITPIYTCADALADKKTFGDTSYPFDSPYYTGSIEYKPGLCPVAERELLETGTLRFYENWSEADIGDVAAAFRKVAAGLPKSR